MSAVNNINKKNIKPTRDEIETAFWEAAEKIPGPALTRKQLAAFAGISPRRLANLDSEGNGPNGGFRQKRRKLYLKKPGIEWALGRVEEVV